MADTARTITALQTTLFQDGQGPGSITPQDIRDFVATTQVRTGGTYGTFCRVTDPEYGADPTGGIDSTVAFQNAMAAGPCIVPAFQADGVTRAIYTVNNCTVPNGATLIGAMGCGSVGTGGVMSSDIGLIIRPMIRCTGTAVRIMNVGQTKLAKFEGLAFDGSSSTSANSADGLSAGSAYVTIRDCTFNNFRNGIGGATGTGSPATIFPNSSWETRLYNSVFANCITGIGDLVDAFVIGCGVGTCQNGISLTSNSAANVLMGCRIEWNGHSTAGANPGGAGYGLNANGSGRLNITGCQFDTNGNAGILLTGFAQWITIQGCWFRNNGCNVTAPPAGTTLIGTSSHIQMNNAYNIVITGNITDFGRNGSSPNVFAPLASINFAGDNEAITITGNDLSGCQGNVDGSVSHGPVSGTTWKTGTAPVTTGAFGYILKNNMGTGIAAADVDTR